MFSLVKFIENVNRFIKIKLKILGWKIKYGKRIKIGKNFRFRKNMIINISKNGYLEIGDNNGFNNYCSINCHKYIKIGNNNMFGENVKLYDHNHIFNDKRVDMQRTFKDREITIGNNNWFASNVIILSKACIKDYNVVGANIVINENIGSNTILRADQQLKKEQIIWK